MKKIASLKSLKKGVGSGSTDPDPDPDPYQISRNPNTAVNILKCQGLRRGKAGRSGVPCVLNRKGEKRPEMTGRPYLLSLLTHQASWDVLRYDLMTLIHVLYTEHCWQQCSVCILGLLGPHICNLFVRIRILPSTSKKMEKNLDFYCFVSSF
jgi:hypothetical protein